MYKIRNRTTGCFSRGGGGSYRTQNNVWGAKKKTGKIWNHWHNLMAHLKATRVKYDDEDAELVIYRVVEVATLPVPDPNGQSALEKAVMDSVLEELS